MTTSRTPLGSGAGSIEAEPVGTSSPSILRAESAAASPNPTRIYISSPMSTRGTDLYMRRLEQIERHFPGSVLIEPRLEFDSQHDWLRRRVEVLRSTNALVFFEDESNFIGRGVVTDVDAAQALQLPVWFVCGEGDFLPDGRFYIYIVPDGLWNEYAQVSYRHEARQ